MITVDVSQYTYALPEERIARHPLANRDESRLLVYRKGAIDHLKFRDITTILPSNSFLYLNDTRVIPARLVFQKDTGATIEIFLLSPVAPFAVVDQAMGAGPPCVWECIIGNVRRWREGQVLRLPITEATFLEAEIENRQKNHVRFRWNSRASFAEMIRAAGETPLPPYLKRKAEKTDALRYQTVYATAEGAVAAPTAGLHFTNETLKGLAHRGIGIDYLTLHVSAGTFQPIKVNNASDHVMHEEQIVVKLETLKNLLDQTRFTVAVGTTSMRTLESVYWYGVRLINGMDTDCRVTQHDPYQSYERKPSATESIRAVIDHLERTGQDCLAGRTSLFIMPGYTFQLVRGLITNFHQPGSTLLLLIAAFAGRDWRKIYDEALSHDYRFLSYGDSSVIIP